MNENLLTKTKNTPYKLHRTLLNETISTNVKLLNCKISDQA